MLYNILWYNTVVSNHFHSVIFFLFSFARSRDFDGLIGIELPVSMYTTKTPIDIICAVLMFDPQLRKILAFSVKDRYQLFYLHQSLQCRDKYFF